MYPQEPKDLTPYVTPTLKLVVLFNSNSFSPSFYIPNTTRALNLD